MSDDHISILSIQENHRVLLRSWNRQNQGAVSSNRLFTPIMLFRSFPHRLSCARLLSADDNIPSHTHKVSLSFFILFFLRRRRRRWRMEVTNKKKGFLLWQFPFLDLPLQVSRCVFPKVACHFFWSYELSIRKTSIIKGQIYSTALKLNVM